ncbi:MAG: Rrf2 family transcriptional regulator [Arenicella sp.]
MRLTKHTDYSLRVLMYLALKPDESHTIPELSEKFKLSKNHLMKVVNHLSRNGFVNAQRGRGGGLRLAKPVESIRVGAVVQAMEQNLEVIDCNANGGCVLLPSCKLKGALNDAMRSFIHTLDNYTLADLVAQPNQLIKLLD